MSVQCLHAAGVYCICKVWAATSVCVCVCRSARETVLLSHLAHLIYSISSGNSCCDIVTLSKLYWLAGPFRGAPDANEMWQPNELLVLNLNRLSRMISMNTAWGNMQRPTYASWQPHAAKISVIGCNLIHKVRTDRTLWLMISISDSHLCMGDSVLKAHFL